MKEADSLVASGMVLYRSRQIYDRASTSRKKVKDRIWREKHNIFWFIEADFDHHIVRLVHKRIGS